MESVKNEKSFSNDEYVCSLDPENLRKAKEELHEDESVRESSISQMREYIAKDPQIIWCRTDHLFLLLFLRVRKFNVQAACEMLRNMLMAIHTEPDSFKLRPTEWDTFIAQSIALPLGPDDKGRMVILCRQGQSDATMITMEEVIRMSILVFQTFCYIESYQINGAVLIIDYQEVKMNHFACWTIPKLKLWISIVNNVLPIRLKEIHLIHLPKFANVVIEFSLSIMKPKLQERVKFHKSLEELRAAVDNSVLPTIYGGQLSLDEANDRFRKRVEQERDRILLLNEFVFDPTIPNPNATNYNRSGLHSEIANEAVIGSFRKLNVD
ncbi:alpha-tocopherol transfer protein-like isoform X2 [Armigeres subalbatus]|uniref:alpha-tocopherol transfer protein-like isoform X2 n=1 Tax=Armigeres subalbatus TaxID=124917 RepID=UPI002ED55645